MLYLSKSLLIIENIVINYAFIFFIIYIFSFITLRQDSFFGLMLIADDFEALSNDFTSESWLEKIFPWSITQF